MFKIGPTTIDIASVNINFEEQKIDVIYYQQNKGESRVLMSKDVPLSVLDPSLIPLGVLKSKLECFLRKRILLALQRRQQDDQ